MSSVSEIRRRFAEQGAGIGAGPPGGSTLPGGRPTPPRKPPQARPPSTHFGGGTNSNGPSSNNLLSSPSHALAARNSNNITANNHQRNSHQVQQIEQEDVYANEDTDLPNSAPAPNRTFQQPSLPEPPQRTLPAPPSRNPPSSWNNNLPPPVPSSARPDSSLPSALTSPTRHNYNSQSSHVDNNHFRRNSTEDNTTSVEYSTAGKGLSYELCTDLQQNFELMPDYDARSGTSRMGFGTDLQDKNAHESILRLNDHELKLLDTLKKVIQHKIKSDREYASALSGVAKLSTQFNAESSITHSSPLVKSWTSFVKEMDVLSKLIKQHADEMNNALVEKLNLLIREKGDAKRQYMQERAKIDQDFTKAKNEVSDNLSKYHRCAKDTKDAKTKYEECQSKGRSAKDIDKAKDRYKKAVIKLHRQHNEYVLSLKAATLHQEHYRTSILPRLLECLQQTQESQVAQVKQMLVDMGNLSNTSSGDFVTSHNSIMRGIAEIRPDQEYLDFVASNKCDPPPSESFDFDTTPMQEFTDNLTENEVVLNKLTLESFQHLHTSLESQLKDLQQNHKDKKQELQNLDEEIRAIQPSTSEEGVLDLISKQKAYRDVSREIQDLRCQEAKVHVQHQMLDVKLSVMEDENELVDGIDLIEPQMNTLNRKSPSVSQLDSNPTQHDNNKKKRLPFTIKKMFPAGSRSHEEQTRDIPLDEEEWYHGALPRTEAEVHLINDGDFLVREKSDASGQIVLSAKAEGRVRHFPIQKNAEGMYRLEGEAFPTVGELIRHQLNTKATVTKASQAVLLKPVARVRDEHDLRHEEIDLGEKLGAGHFGDVFRGTRTKDGTAVAVKTCKETVDASTRRKFLKEANILKQYNHANIVKLIGVCTDKHPIYIVMELVPGGDLLTFLRKDNTDLSAKQMTKMGEDAAAGMAYLESKNCIHRDLAARNCLVGHKNVIKISDFGMSRQEELYTIEHGTMRQIPIKWTAPEAMNFGQYTSASDVWSFGILMWEVFSGGSSPYPGIPNHDAKAQIDQGYRMPSPQGCAPEIYELMLRCWKYEASERPKFKEIHTLLKSLAKKMK